VKASAPGKLIVAGEYGVLDGGEAVVLAVNRRAVARVTGAPVALSPFLAAVVETLDRCKQPDAAAIVKRVVVDTSALYDGDLKLGLGSSAAATVAATACAMSTRDAIYNVAAAAHLIAQGRGSGADVAAAVYGGVIGFRSGRMRALTLPPLRWIPLWTGAVADTVTLVGAVMAKRPDLGPVVAAADALAAARTTADAIAAIDAGADAIVALGVETGVALEPPVVAAARRIARSGGGTAKTTGAGGGDVAIVALPPEADEAIVRSRLIEAGCRLLDLAIDPQGVDIQSGDE
jgi:phosphomevalonate kinase